ncbi:MAG: ABC transporter permease [Clostridia bacterium]|nr:ABC transporter permease [Clostridia bacterium]
MHVKAFAKRTLLEILRDPLLLVFGLGFPGALILLLTAIQSKVPAPIFALESITPGMTVFGLSFLTLFSATLVAKDRESTLLLRLYATPMRAQDFLLGYMLPMIPIALLQSAFCFLIGMLLGLKCSINMLWGLLFLLPIALFFIGLGLLFGSILTQKQVGGICGALLTNLTAWLSGVWIDLKLLGGAFEAVANALPFAHAATLEKMVFAGTFHGIVPHLLWVLCYTAAILVLATALFLRQMKRQ